LVCEGWRMSFLGVWIDEKQSGSVFHSTALSKDTRTLSQLLMAGTGSWLDRGRNRLQSDIAFSQLR